MKDGAQMWDSATNLVNGAVEEERCWVWPPGADKHRRNTEERRVIALALDDSVDSNRHGQGGDVVAPHEVRPLAASNNRVGVEVVAARSNHSDACGMQTQHDDSYFQKPM
jgi:hypothetical protein